MMLIDLFELPSGETYENTYGAWMDIFRQVAEAEEVTVKDPPAVWIPLLYYLGADLSFSHPAGVTFQSHSKLMEQSGWIDTGSGHQLLALCQEQEDFGRLRELVEAYEGYRPELVDALYKSDMEWKTIGRRHTMQKEFVVASNGSFQRPEVLAYLKKLREYIARAHPHRKCVLVPCAADKPYPAPLHEAVREAVGPDYQLIIFTGTLGLVPEELWPEMPLYDSGMPNQWRVQETVQQFFGAQDYETILVYGDFYNSAVYSGLLLAGYRAGPSSDFAERILERQVLGDRQLVGFVNPVKHYTEYLNLLDPALVRKLKNASKVL